MATSHSPVCAKRLCPLSYGAPCHQRRALSFAALGPSDDHADLKRRGLAIGPELAVADGALGFWQAIEEVWPTTRGQRCWMHKTANLSKT